MAAFDRKAFSALVVCLIVLLACDDHGEHPGTESRALTAEQFKQVNHDWRARRLERLTDPHGWLSLVGLIPLAPGRPSIGSATDNDIVLPGGPAHWGRLEISNEAVRFEAAEGVRRGDRSAVTIDGRAVSSAVLTVDGEDGPTKIEADAIQVHLVRPGGRLALRVRDPDAETRTGFVGLEYFPLDPDWRLEARFIAHPAGTTLQVANVMGQLIDEPNPGVAKFERDGRTFALEAVLEDGRLFFIFADRTSGRESYGLGRFLYADLPRSDNIVTLDFNQAYNPPCAFNAFTTCPLPPQANRIPIPIRAGEQRYAGKPGIAQPVSIDDAGVDQQ
ncbi:MAG: DUF1684 domain-containing protein [Xanthomonadaceae bacterium]|nr:DUF1684 domain-containing protein [Xanthomonadaceae bacterium]